VSGEGVEENNIIKGHLVFFLLLQEAKAKKSRGETKK